MAHQTRKSLEHFPSASDKIDPGCASRHEEHHGHCQPYRRRGLLSSHLDSYDSVSTPPTLSDNELDSFSNSADAESTSPKTSMPSTPSQTSQYSKSPPESSTETTPLVLQHGPASHTIHVPRAVAALAAIERDAFLNALDTLNDEQQDNDDETSDGSAHPSRAQANAELLVQWMAFVASRRTQHRSDRLLCLLIEHVERDVLDSNDIHVFAAGMHASPRIRQRLLRDYFTAKVTVDARLATGLRPALLRAADQGSARLFAVFGGQGSIVDHLGELRELRSTYRSIVDPLLKPWSRHLSVLAQHPEARPHLRQGLDVVGWLGLIDASPGADYLLSGPVSFPLIGLIQFVQYAVTCILSGCHPREFRAAFRGVAGHSQGLLIAAVISASDSWETLVSNAELALTVLFWTGLRCQQVSSRAASTPPIVSNALEHGEGYPSPMLLVRGLCRPQLQEHVDALNASIGKKQPAETIEVALHNSPRSLVVAGPCRFLHALNVRLREIKASSGVDETRVPFSQRKVPLFTKYLPVAAPFHSKHVAAAVEVIMGDVHCLHLRSSELEIPVYSPVDGADLADRGSGADGDRDLLPSIVRMIVAEPVDWIAATSFPGATHVVDFGPGGVSGIGSVTAANKQGTSVRVIFASVLDDSAHDASVGYQAELLNRDFASLVHHEAWVDRYAPTLVRAPSGRIHLSTKLSRLLALPPVMVGAMTPTTAHWDVVTAVMRAGYHVELAGGGFHDRATLRDALRRIAKTAPPGRGITLNTLYVNPQSFKWQLDVVRTLKAEGVCIDGLTIGAGIPSPSVAAEHIGGLGLRHVAYKPGSVEGIFGVIEIAKNHAEFPVILQWTGGRGGGHHSCEDFHEPILTTYARIRECDNIVLVAGSGFGGYQDSYAYLSGQWSLKFGRPPMPFDGILLGSRIMAAKETHTSLPAKEAICKTAGVPDSRWEETYNPSLEGGGGVLTVISEMGQPIHKLATRGVQLWAELDKTVFSLPKSEQLSRLLSQKEYLIHRLNSDFQKVWFGMRNGRAADLEQMTYGQVLRRLFDLMYVKSESRWIHASYKVLFRDFLRLTRERLGGAATVEQYDDSLPGNSSGDVLLEALVSECPQVDTELMLARDISYFLSLCRTSGRKPVPFIPVLDEHFQTYFKKDSLWQSEDLAAVVGNDVGRTCILHGPVAAQHTTKVDEPVAEILESINAGWIRSLSEQNSQTDIPQVEYFGQPEEHLASYQPSNNISVTQYQARTTYRLPWDKTAALPSATQWISLLAGGTRYWARALFSVDRIVTGDEGRCAPNMVARILAPSHGLVVCVDYPLEPHKMEIQAQHPECGLIVRMRAKRNASPGSEQTVTMELFSPESTTGGCVSFRIEYMFDPEAGYAPIREVTAGKRRQIADFYRRVWLGHEPLDFDVDMDLDTILDATFHGETTVVSAEIIASFTQVIGGSAHPLFHGGPEDESSVPMDLALILGWKPIVKPLFLTLVGGDLLKLVHLSNVFKVVGSRGLHIGDVVESKSRVTSVSANGSGTVMEVTAVITRQGTPVIEIVSRFLFRGIFAGDTNTMEKRPVPRMTVDLCNAREVAILTSRKWIHFDNLDEFSLISKQLEFEVETVRRPPKNAHYGADIETVGVVYVRGKKRELSRLGTVHHVAHHTAGNPVLSYLQRHGRAAEKRVDLEHAIPLTGDDTKLVMPANNKDYARVSGDHNPIHTVEAMAAYGGLPGTITHGMYVSAAVRNLVTGLCHDLGPMLSYSVSFVGMVRAGETLCVHASHVAMCEGRKVLALKVTRQGSGETVLTGEAQVEQAPSAYIFTGQGSQQVGMGMELYDSSAAARDVWDRADRYFVGNYGFAITNIVRLNPKELTVHFGGQRGKKIRKNYMAMEFAQQWAPSNNGGDDGTNDATSDKNGDNCNSKVSAVGTQHMVMAKMFKDIHADSASYTFRCPTGLLHATQFTQPAMTLVNLARFRDMEAKGLVQAYSSFAGHSLGEYSALSTLGGLMSVEQLMSITFFRGMTMRLAVPYNDAGRSEYSMCAVNPSKVAGYFTQEQLEVVVQAITGCSGWLLEIVNHNVENVQYVCAGTLRALLALSRVLEHIRTKHSGPGAAAPSRAEVHAVVASCVAAADLEVDPCAVQLPKTPSVTPLRGIDVPFHSSYLRPGIDAFRQFLRANITKSAVSPELLLGRWIPNLTGKLFGISEADFAHVHQLTGSEVLGQVLERWGQCLSDAEEDGGA